MSVLVEGIPCVTCSLDPSSHTLLSASFAARHFPGRSSGEFLVTAHLGLYGYFSCTINCRISSVGHNDIVLGGDWKAYTREGLTFAGYNLPASFDPYHLLPGLIPFPPQPVLSQVSSWSDRTNPAETPYAFAVDLDPPHATKKQQPMIPGPFYKTMAAGTFSSTLPRLTSQQRLGL
ncbi:hypothetical protein C8J57DRAFT_1409992 [Mycena rebaudengoi]|nr:hypothetical protein C8J57DRAFT_1409992 [Mycena rebaudengoi]